jgi:ssDNA-binding replication factor A large subunit
MTDADEFLVEIAAVKEAVPDVDEERVAEEFRRYREEFLIPPRDALRSVVKKFQGEAGLEQTGGTASLPSKRESKKVELFKELAADDGNVTIEVEVVTYTPRMQMIRGEERQIAFGWIEDNPWVDGGERVRWDFKDWGGHAESLVPGSVVRLEGVSVNEWQGKRSININQSSRIAILREGGRTVTIAPNEPVDIARAGEMDGFVTVTGRVIASRAQTINRKDGSGTIDMVKGRLADNSGTIGFVSWGEFEHPVGTLLRVEGAAIRRFRDTPELNIGDHTKVEVYHDKGFASLQDLESSSVLKIADLRDGARDVTAVVQVVSWEARTFTTQDGEEKTVWGGDVLDPSGSCRMTAWEKVEIKISDKPVAVRLENFRVRAWQGTPDITIDNAEQVTVLDKIPWDAIDADSHTVEVPFTELIKGNSRRGVTTTATIVSVKLDSGLIKRCTEGTCRRVLRDGACFEHGPQTGENDLRLRMVMDDGICNASLIVGRDPTEAFLSTSLGEVEKEWDVNGGEEFMLNLRSKLIGHSLCVRGRVVIDEQGAMIMADSIEIAEVDTATAVEELRQRWGVFA